MTKKDLCRRSLDLLLITSLLLDEKFFEPISLMLCQRINFDVSVLVRRTSVKFDSEEITKWLFSLPVQAVKMEFKNQTTKVKRGRNAIEQGYPHPWKHAAGSQATCNVEIGQTFALSEKGVIPWRGAQWTPIQPIDDFELLSVLPSQLLTFNNWLCCHSSSMQQWKYWTKGMVQCQKSVLQAAWFFT